MDSFTAKNGATYAFREQPGCSGCAFDIKNGCTRTDDAPCSPTLRPDKRSGIWVRVGIEPVATDIAPREALLAHIADLTAERDRASSLFASIASTHAKLAAWARETLPHELQARFFAVLANGAPDWKTAPRNLAVDLLAVTAERDLLAARLAEIERQEPVAWRELSRRLYVELFHCDQQMREMTRRGKPIWTQGATVRDVLADARDKLGRSPPTAAAAPERAEPDHLEDERGMVCRCGPDGCSDSVACPRAGGAA